MRDLPKCKLCGASAHRQQGPFAHMVEHELAQSLQHMCPLEMVPMSEDEWCALMAPPAVTDAMVERADCEIERRVGTNNHLDWHDVRAVLEAALKE